MRNNWKKKALTVLSLVLIISMLFSSGLSTLAAEAAISIEKTIISLAAGKAVQKLEPKGSAPIAQSNPLKGLSTAKTPTLLSSESEEKPSLVKLEATKKEDEPLKSPLKETDTVAKAAPEVETKAETKASTEEKAADAKTETVPETAPETTPEKKVESEETKEAEKPEEKTTEEAAKAEAAKAEAAKVEAAKAEAAKAEAAKAEAAKDEDKKEEAPKAGEVAATQAEITIMPSTDASMKVETVVAEEESSDTIVSGNKVDKGTTIKVTVTPIKAGDWLRLHVGEEYEDIYVPGGASNVDKDGSTEVVKGNEDTDKADSGATPVKKVDDKTEEDKTGPSLTTVSAEADKEETPKATVKLGDSGGDLDPVSFEFVINDDVTIEIMKIAAAGAPLSVNSTTAIYNAITSTTPNYSFTLADTFTAHNRVNTTTPPVVTYGWSEIVTELNTQHVTITLSTTTNGVKFTTDSGATPISSVTLTNLTLQNFILADTIKPALTVSGASSISNSTVGNVILGNNTSLTITGGVLNPNLSGQSTVGNITTGTTPTINIGNHAKVGVINQHANMPPANFKVGENVEIASLKAPYPSVIGKGSKIKLAGDKVGDGASGGILNGAPATGTPPAAGKVYFLPVSAGGTITVESGATWNVLNGEISDGTVFSGITFENGSTIGVKGADNSIPADISFDAGDKDIIVGTAVGGVSPVYEKITINNYADEISTATPPNPPKSVMGAVDFKTKDGDIQILTTLERGKNTDSNTTIKGGIITAESTGVGHIRVGSLNDNSTPADAFPAGSETYLDINIGSGTVDVFGSAKTITSTNTGGLITVNSLAGTVKVIDANKSGSNLHDVLITQIGQNQGITSIHGRKVDVNITNTGTTIDTVSAQNGLAINAPNTAITSAFLNLNPLNPTIVAKSIKDYYLGSDMLNTTLNSALVTEVVIPAAKNTETPPVYIIENIHMGGLNKTISNTGAGALKLTFAGGIRGSVFMGGENGATANVTVPLQFELIANNEIGGNIYGGSRGTSTTKSSTITLTAGTVAGSVYGGAFGAGTTGAATITALPASTTKITGSIYGGGYSGLVKNTLTPVSTGKSTITIGKDVFDNTGSPTKDLIFGGSQFSGTVEEVEIAIGTAGAPVTFARKGNIYGGGDGAGTGGNASVGNTKITFFGAGTATAGTAPTIYDLKGSLFGGSKTRGASGNIVIDLQGVGVSGDVQGGSAAINATGSVDVSIKPDGTKKAYIGGNVYGGGKGAATGEIASLTPKRTTRVTLGTDTTVAKNLFGGGNGGAVSPNGSHVIIAGGAKVAGDIYGGGNGASVTSTSGLATQVDYSGVVTGGNIYGGSLNGNISGNTGTQVNINAQIGATGAERNVYGGNNGNGTSIIGLGKGTEVNINNAVVGFVYGGGAVSGGTSTIGGGTAVNIVGTVSRSVYGGEYGTVASGDYSTITGGTVVDVGVNIPGPVYGGSHNINKGTMDVDKTQVTVKGGSTVTGSVFGGGHSTGAGVSSVSGVSGTTGTPPVPFTTGTVVDINGTVSAPIYGGGESTNGHVKEKATLVNINAAQTVPVYGGGLADGGSSVAQVTINTDVQIKANVGNTTTSANVYGGGHSVAAGTTSIGGIAQVTLNDTKTVTGFIYGGGHGESGKATAADTQVTLGVTSGTAATTKVSQSVYGGGYGEGATSHVIGTARVVGEKATVGANVYGGGHAEGADANVNTVAKVELTGVILTAAGVDEGFVYGGGHGADATSSTGETAVTIIDMIAPKSVYGGGHGDTTDAPVTNLGLAPTATGKTLVTIGTGAGAFDAKVTDSVYGGGRAVAGNATTVQTGVVINLDAEITGTVYGGGHGNPATSPATGTSANVTSILDSDPSATNVSIAGKVTAGVYGGGYATGTHTADVIGGTLVKVLATADISKNVYGGGRNTAVKQTATVDIEGATEVKTIIFGGGHGEARNAETQRTKITVNTAGGAAVKATDVYGGGYANDFSAPVHEGTVINAKNLTTTQSVYGGGFASTATGIADATVGANRGGTLLENSTKITLSGTSNIGHSVYGGGHALAGNATVGDGTIAHPATKIELSDNTTVGKDVYGGGRNMLATTNADIKGYTDILLKGLTDVTENVYGGGHAEVGVAHVDEFTKVTLEGNSKAKNVFGGGHALNAVAHIKNGTSGKVGTDVTIQENAQVSESVYGGGYSPAIATGMAANIEKGGTKVTVTGAGTAIVDKNVYGGGHSDVADAKVVGDTTVTISKTNPATAVGGSVYGGGRSVTTNAEIAGNTTVTVTEKSAISGSVFGGGHAEKGLAKVLGNTNVEIAKASVVTTDVYGGGQGVIGVANIEAGTNAVGTANVTLNNTAKVKGSVYGGGRAENGAATIANITNVTINGAAYGDLGAIVETNVYGGGHGIDSNADILGGLTNVTVHNGKVGGTGGNVYGGGRVDTTSGTAKVPGDTKVTITESLITKDVYGGGIVEITPAALTNSALAEVARFTTVTLGVQKSGRYQVDGNVYGGGHNAHVNQETNVLVYQGTVASDVFGGGHGFAQINLPKPTTQAALKAAVTHVTIDNNGRDNAAGYSVKKSVYGGGRSQDADINGSTQVLVHPLAKIDLDLYGGGRGSELGFDKSADIEPDTSIGYLAASSNTIWGGTNVNIKGWIGQDAYAGGQHQSHVMGDDGTYIMLDQFGYVHRDLHGGGRNSTVLKNTETIVASGGTGNRDVYGGTANHKEATPAGIQGHYIGEHTLVTIRSGGTVKRDVYGAGDFSETRGAKGTTVDISGHVYRDVYGGGNRFALVLGVKGTKVDIYPTGLVGQPLSNPDPKHPSNYPSFDFDDDLNTVYNWPSAGHVYGGGSFNSHVAMSTPTAGQGEGTNVTVHAKGTVRGVVFGGGKGSNVVAHDPAEGNANVLILGYVGRVHGGGRVEEYKGTQLEAKTVDTTNGTKLHVTGPSAIVFTDAYGGGFGGFKGSSNLVDGALNLKADVLIDNGSNVRYRVFGGGNQFGATTKETTNVVFTGDTTVIGHAKELFEQVRDNAFISGWLSNISYKADNRAKNGTDYFDRWMFYRDPEFTSLGSIYGGGNGTHVGVSTNIDIGDNTQIALNFVSGGNIGVKSLNRSAVEIPRTIQIGKMGAGDLVENSYTNTSQYGLIRVLGDYTAANAKSSYLTVYYHLDGVDGGHTTNKTLIMDDAYQTSGTNYNSELVVDTGIYHPWRPEPHTVVRVEPSIQMVNGSKFRMQYGYTIKLQNGIFPESSRNEDLISLLMDVPLNPASTSKIYAPKDNVIQGKPFHFRELPFTIELSRLQDVSNEDERGLRIYFPSNNVDDTDGKNTNSGGKDSTDKGTGNSGGWGGGWSGGAATSGVAVSTGKVVGATGSVGYQTDESKVVSQDEVLKNLQTALANSKTTTVTVNERLAGQVSGATLLAMAQNAAKAGKTAIYQGDTVRGNRIEGRMSIEAARASGVTGTLKTGVYTAVQMTKQVGTMFAKFFQNRLSVVRLAQEGPLGVEVKIAAYVNLQGMNTNTLHFYAYSAQNNNYQRMPNPRYSVDKNGYLHFYTNVGGHIIITDKPLVRK